MSNVNALLTQRLKKGAHTSKMTELGKQTADGQLTSFSGVFSVTELSPVERQLLESILTQFVKFEDAPKRAPSPSSAIQNESGADHAALRTDLNALISITAEVKAINNQAALLHGERIKRAQNILKNYREGAFSAWLMAAYGNRQTPYNFLQYFEFCEAMPKVLRPLIEAMPRQPVYTLASRDGPLEKKILIVQNFQGQTKQELLQQIRLHFPLAAHDRRKIKSGAQTIRHLQRALESLSEDSAPLSSSQKKNIFQLLETIHALASQGQ